MRRHALVSLLLTAGACVLSLSLWHGGVLERLEGVSWDWRVQHLSGRGGEDPRVKLVLIDQTSLDWAEQVNQVSWPWPREFHAAILEYCMQDGAQGVLFDLLFTESSRVRDDAVFAEVLSRHEAVWLAGALSDAEVLAAVGAESVTGFYPMQAGAEGGRWPQARSLSAPVPELRAVAQVANVILPADADGVFRRMPLFRAYGDLLMPSLGVAPFVRESGAQAVGLDPKGGVRLGEHAVETDAEGRLLLNYAGRVGEAGQVRAAAVVRSFLQKNEGVEPELPRGLFEGAYVLVGTSAPGLLDLKVTPVDKVMPGVAIHALALQNLLSGRFLREASGWAHGALLVAMVWVVSLVVLRTRRLWVGVLGTWLALFCPVLLGVLAYWGGWWWPMVPGVLAVLVVVVVGAAYNYATEGRQRAYIKTAFSHYLSPVVIERLLEDPGRLDLGGEYRELTIFFSDLQGFSAISEVLDPRDLTALLNDYLSEMTDIILDSGGTLDKYEGDAIIAFWNAPVDQPDHALRGCRAAVCCQERLAQLRAGYAQRAGRDLVMRIGMHTGKVVVGNMGSRRRFDYTMLGDAANLAARLEGANKYFGTQTMVSEATVAQLGGAVPLREIGALRVVGRQTPVVVYQPCAAEEVASWEKALGLFKAGRYAEAEEAFAAWGQGDGLAAFYLGQARAYREHPERVWPGVWNLQEK